MQLYLIGAAVIGLVVCLGTAVAWVEHGAVAKVEAQRLVVANRAKAESLQVTQNLSSKARQSQMRDLAAARERIDRLEAEIAAIPEVAPIDEYCTPGCKPRWGQPKATMP